jgi:hypothetical protein
VSFLDSARFETVRGGRGKTSGGIEKIKGAKGDIARSTILRPQLNRNDRLRPNNGMQRTALRAAADAERLGLTFRLLFQPQSN